MNKIEFTQFLQNTKDNIQEKLNPKKNRYKNISEFKK